MRNDAAFWIELVLRLFGSGAKRAAGSWGRASLIILLLAGGPFPALAQVRVLHSFSGPDGTAPTGNIVQRRAGEICGTTSGGGNGGFGTVYCVATRASSTRLAGARHR